MNFSSMYIFIMMYYFLQSNFKFALMILISKEKHIVICIIIYCHRIMFEYATNHIFIHFKSLIIIFFIAIVSFHFSCRFCNMMIRFFFIFHICRFCNVIIIQFFSFLTSYSFFFCKHINFTHSILCSNVKSFDFHNFKSNVLFFVFEKCSNSTFILFVSFSFRIRFLDR